MPSFYSNPFARQLPLTPPDLFDEYPDGNRGAGQLPAIHPSSQNAQISAYEQGVPDGRDYVPHYSQYNLAPMTRQVYPPDNNGHVPSSYAASFRRSSNAYGPSSAPLLPPIRVPDRASEGYQPHVRSKRAPSVPQPKEEKPMGGVAAHLDYEMEEMVDFVSEMAQGMYAFYTSRICLADIDMTRSVAQSKAPVHPDYRKYVSQVLSSTRLPSSTILLGLHYLGQRMTILSADGNYNHGSGQVYRMLTIALVLGSKFLDDNTFQNRSWSEVSNIPVSELNVLEVEWLMAIQWDMHINPDDPEGFQLWRQRWQTWQASKLDALSLAESLKQTHIDVRSHLDGTNMQRQRSSHQRSSPIRHQTASFVNEAINNGYKDHSQSQWATPCYEYWPLIHPQTDYSPPETPEWYAHGGFGYGHATQPSAMKVPLPLQILGPNAPQSSYHTAFAQQCYPYGHGNACGCSQCIPQYDRHSMRHSQTVAG